MALSAGGALTAVSGFIQENAQIGKYPTNQAEWNAFIQQLARWIVEYEGSFNAIGGGFDGSVTFNNILYYRYGKIVVVKLPVQEATSDAASFSLTSLPNRIRPTVTQVVPCTGLVDNGTPITTCGQATVGSDGVLSFAVDGAGAGFATSGPKGFGDTVGNSIIYSLFDARKID